MYSFVHNLLPPIYDDSFIKNKSFIKYVTRQSEHFYLPNFNYEFSRTTIQYAGPKLWNGLPLAIKSSPSLNTFKQNYNKYLINN